MEVFRPELWPELLHSGKRVFLGSGVSVPRALVSSMLEDATGPSDVEVVHAFVHPPVPWIDPQYAGRFRTNTFFLDEAMRRAVGAGRADYTPCSISEVPRLFTSGQLRLDLALIQASPPDHAGYLSLGTNVDVVAAAVRSAQTIVAQINPRMPHTRGPARLHRSAIHYALEHEQEIPEVLEPDTTDVARRIAGFVAELVEDGSTVQVGFGRVEQAALEALGGHRRLGLHSSLFSTRVMRLVQCGALDGSEKRLHPGKAICDHVAGTRELYDFVHENAGVELHPGEYVNSADRIAANNRMVSINGAIEMDLTGQVVRDSVGRGFFHGIGEQVDFLRGAAMSEGGKPIIVLPSTTIDGKKSRVVSRFSPGTAVIAGRGDVHYVVTEYGIARLYGRSVRERVLELVQVAHPAFRDRLLHDARKNRWVPEFHVVPGSSLETDEGVLEHRRVELAGRSWVLRPLHPTDIRRMQEFFYAQDPESVRLRYGHRVKIMPAEAVYRFVNVDQSRDVVLGLFEPVGEHDEVRAVASCFVEDVPEIAEVAFFVHRGHRRRGMSAFLLCEMARIAAPRGIRRFWAQVLRENRAMRDLFESFGATRRSSLGGDTHEMWMDVEEILTRSAASLRPPPAADGDA